VTVNGQPTPATLTLTSNGQTQVSFVLAQGFAGVGVNLAVVVDGSSSVTYSITVR